MRNVRSRRLLPLLGSVLLMAGCGSTATRTVVKTVPTPSTTTSTPSTTTTTTPTTTTPTTTSPVTTTPTPTNQPVFFEGVAGGGQQRPPTLELTGDGTLFVTHVQWSSWGGSTATGSGTAEFHGCTPNCAEAPTHTALVSIRLSGIRTCGDRRYYAGVTLTRSSGRLLDEGFLQRTWSPC